MTRALLPRPSKPSLPWKNSGIDQKEFGCHEQIFLVSIYGRDGKGARGSEESSNGMKRAEFPVSIRRRY
jgi:hypothetical protein